nr:MAG TPA: hypothetical protein [Caudoviricetes sp.]
MLAILQLGFSQKKGMKMNSYVHVLDADGKRITSIVDDMLSPVGETELIEVAKTQYPEAEQYVFGDDTMLDQFLNGKAYVNGEFIDIQLAPYEPTKAERIADIKNYYDKRFDALDKAVLRRRLANTDISDLQTQYKTLQAEMVAKIKAVK